MLKPRMLRGSFKIDVGFGKLWISRALFGELKWEYDPVFQETTRRLYPNRKPVESLWNDERNEEVALLDDIMLVIQVSKTLVTLSLTKPNKDLARMTLELLASSLEQAEKIFESQKPWLNRDLFYALGFCLERDLKSL